MTVRVVDTVDTRAAEAAIVKLLTFRHGRKDFFVFDSDQLRKTSQQTARIMSLLISAVAAIALLVGGIGVMNIMLVSVTERTKEIGLRVAAGARCTDIMLQFLIEAVTVCIAGAASGVALALAIGWLFCTPDSAFPMVFSPTSIVVACVTAILIGLSFGFLPARNAARLNPVDALPQANSLIADRGYDSTWFRQELAARGIEPCIPSSRSRKRPYRYDKVLYRQRHKLENLFAKLKDWRRIATRYDRCAHAFFSAICIAATVIFWL